MFTRTLKEVNNTFRIVYKVWGGDPYLVMKKEKGSGASKKDDGGSGYPKEVKGFCY